MALIKIPLTFHIDEKTLHQAFFLSKGLGMIEPAATFEQFMDVGNRDFYPGEMLPESENLKTAIMLLASMAITDSELLKKISKQN